MNQWIKSLFRLTHNKLDHIPSNYDKLTRQQLIAKIIALEKQQKHTTLEINKIRKEKKPFDISHYGQRRIALKVAYLGWEYFGFASQNDPLVSTVEDQLFKAFETCRFIENRDGCNFTRCGRTDKGVSGLGQVIALDVRSSNKKGVAQEPMSYIERLNRILPQDVRILAWAPVNSTFNARFDCQSRTYKYFFEKGDLDIDAMRQAASYMIGKHDFRNFCRLDPSKNITNYERTILYLDIRPISHELYEVELKGTAFLWHQVRCIMAILFLTGKKLESPHVVKDLLDIEKVPAKPNYDMASDLPLLLYDCEFKDIDWRYANEEQEATKNYLIPTPVRTQRHFRELWSSSLIKAQLYKTCLEQVSNVPSTESQQFVIPLGAGKVLRTAHYKKLLDRPRADSDQVKKEKYRLRQLRKEFIDIKNI
ncbi:pseudouridine synthase [Gilbertella persicaria]|uniref:tRNA pseudouridine synthase 3 n=1 Tax=Rhizopus stolonifer TaxID=4846 RepID=A0A367J8E3_RHIST|nr:pseudouridine synthase [Gilbertella persicaria]KAI8062772.1 pseudouridine synthase [Gilbertella persicaria]RCH86186.1 tRNA pseudouridine synthase 3 [Rhizopus stolonifer]